MTMMGPAPSIRLTAEAIVTGLTVELGGIPTLLRASDVRRAGAVAHLLADAPQHPGPSTVAVRFEAGPAASPDRPPDLDLNGMSVWHGERELVAMDESGLVGRANDRSVTVVGDSDDELATAFRRLFHVCAAYVFAHHDRFVLHGGTVLAGGETAVLILGETESGKSTLVAAALEAGWPALGDDMMVIRADQEGLVVSGIPRPVTVPREVAGELGTAGSSGADRRRRVELPRGRLRSGWWPIGAVIAVGHGSTEGGELRTLGAEDALGLLVGAFIPSHTPRLLRQFFPHAATLSRLPAVELRHDPDPARRVGSAAKLLESVRSLV